MSEVSACSRVSLAVSRSLLEEVIDALTGEAAPPRASMERVLARAWSAAIARRSSTVTALGADERARLAVGLEEPLAARLAAAPPLVRSSMLGQVRDAVGLLAGLVGHRAPRTTLDACRARLARALGALDPEAPFPEEPPPALPELLGGDGQSLGVNAHAWLEEVLQCARLPGTLRSSPAVLREVAPVAVRAAMRPGIEWTCFGTDGALRSWLPPDLALPHVLDQGRTVAGLSGGPVTYALAGEPLSGTVAPEIARGLRGLLPGQALAAFLWLDSGVELPWIEQD